MASPSHRDNVGGVGNTSYLESQVRRRYAVGGPGQQYLERQAAVSREMARDDDENIGMCRRMWEGVVDVYESWVSSAFMFWTHLVTAESFVVAALSISCVLFYHFYEGGAVAANYSWTMVSFAIVFPLTHSIAEVGGGRCKPY